MFLFKASSADCYDWCAHPPSDSPVQRLAPRGSGGEAFPLNRTVDFPQGNFTIPPLIRSQSSLQTVSSSAVSPFSFPPFFSLFPFWIWEFASGHGSSVDVRWSAYKLLPPLLRLCFDSFRCASVFRCGARVDSAVWPDVWDYAAKS